MAIPFTQYLRPDGRETLITIERSLEIENVARRLIALGCRFEAEVLRTNHLSLEALGPKDEDGDPTTLAMEIVPNGPGVPDAVDRLVLEAAASLSLEVPS